jgi:hypothetical protein
MHLVGQYVPEDHAEAVKWFRKAARRGHIGARYNLGVAHFNGDGAPQDYPLAYFWMKLAVAATPREYRAGIEDVKARIGRMLTPEQLEKTERMLREWEETPSAR